MASLCTAVMMLVWIAAACQTAADDTIPERFRRLDKNTTWHCTAEIPMKFRTYHPQGMALIGERIYVSSVQVLDRKEGRGVGHLFESSLEGELLRAIQLGEGAMYHPGGIDYDGAVIWVSVAEYRPDSRSVVYAVAPGTMTARRVFDFDDHLGAILHDPQQGMLVGVSWGSRRFYRWKTQQVDGAWVAVDAAHPEQLANGNHYIDYQDMQQVPGTAYALCSGLMGYAVPGRGMVRLNLGGVDLVDLALLRAVHQVPIALWVNPSLVMTQNPFCVRATEKGLRFYFMPADDRSILYVYEPNLKDPP